MICTLAHHPHAHALTPTRMSPPPRQPRASLWSQLREARYGTADYEPSGSLDHLAPRAWYLSGVDKLYRRRYARKADA